MFKKFGIKNEKFLNLKHLFSLYTKKKIIQNQSNFQSNTLQRIKFTLPMIAFLYFSKYNCNKIQCFKAKNKEIDKILNNLEEKIKNLEFKYAGKLQRQNIE